MRERPFGPVAARTASLVGYVGLAAALGVLTAVDPAAGLACASVVVAYVSRVQAPLVNRAAALLLSIAALALLGVPIAARIRAWKSRRRFVRDRG